MVHTLLLVRRTRSSGGTTDTGGASAHDRTTRPHALCGRVSVVDRSRLVPHGSGTSHGDPRRHRRSRVSVMTGTRVATFPAPPCSTSNRVSWAISRDSEDVPNSVAQKVSVHRCRGVRKERTEGGTGDGLRPGNVEWTFRADAAVRGPDGRSDQTAGSVPRTKGRGRSGSCTNTSAGSTQDFPSPIPTEVSGHDPAPTGLNHPLPEEPVARTVDRQGKGLRR